MSHRCQVETHLRPEILNEVSNRSPAWELTLQPQWIPYVPRTLTLKTILWFAQRAYLSLLHDLGAHSHYYTKQDLPEAFVSRNSVSYEVGTS
jgi:hypothetical protein